MKQKFSPFFLLAVVLALLGLYIIFYSIYIDSNLGPLVGFVVIFLAGLCLLASYVIRSVFKAKIKTQIVLESALIMFLIIAFYKINTKVVLHPQQNFNGYIFIVYEVNKEPVFEPENIFSRTIDVIVPDNGIILTSSKSPNGITNRLTIDTGLNAGLYPGEGVTYAFEFLTCDGKKYMADVFLIGEHPSGWSYEADTLNRRVKTELICKMITED